jgi:transposase
LNVLKPNLRISIHTLLQAGKAQREIARVVGVDPRTVRRIAREAKCPGVATGFSAEKTDVEGQNAPPRPPAPKPPVTPSECEIHRRWIECQVVLGRNAMSIYQDLVERHGFRHAYYSVKRFVGRLKAREPERYDVLDALPGEESQVDFGEGALTRLPNGKYRRPYLFVMTLKYSGKSFRKVVWKADQESWALMHEEAFRTFGGSVQYVVLDNLKQGVIKPDLYEPAINPVYAAMLAHYSAVADAARIADPNQDVFLQAEADYRQERKTRIALKPPSPSCVPRSKTLTLPISQRDLARRLGVHETQISRDERNEDFGITVERAAKILDALYVRLRTQVAIDPLPPFPVAQASPSASATNNCECTGVASELNMIAGRSAVATA